MRKKRMSSIAFGLFFMAAVCIDIFGLVFGLVPIIGIIISPLVTIITMTFILLARLTFWIRGYATRNMALTIGTTGILELLPVVSAIVPGATTFVVLSYIGNRSASKASRVKEIATERQVARNMMKEQRKAERIMSQRMREMRRQEARAAREEAELEDAYAEAA